MTELMPVLLQEALDALPIAKRMRSAASRTEFVRPVQWVVLMRDAEVIPATLQDFATLGRAYFSDDYFIDPKPLAKNILKQPELKTWLPQLAEHFTALPDFNAESTEAICREMADALHIKPGILINGMRTVLTGQLAGPSMFDILTTLGQDTVVRRLSRVDHLYAS